MSGGVTDEDDGVLFRATDKGVPQAACHATPEEIQALAGPIGVSVGHPPDDTLDYWSLISIRSSVENSIHALGWRRLMENTWITSRVLAINMTMGTVRTGSGAFYFLGIQDQRELDPELRAHLMYALGVWGYDDVRS
jgi:hypothetical protein